MEEQKAKDFKEHLKEYLEDFDKLEVKAVECEDYCGHAGLMGLQDEQIRLQHARWMTEVMLEDVENWDEPDIREWLGFIRGILWCTKLKGIKDIYG